MANECPYGVCPDSDCQSKPNDPKVMVRPTSTRPKGRAAGAGANPRGYRGDRERFTVESLLPHRDSGSDIPDDQTYLVLAWLRSIGLVTQHDRQGYSQPADASRGREAERHWGELATR